MKKLLSITLILASSVLVLKLASSHFSLRENEPITESVLSKYSTATLFETEEEPSSETNSYESIARVARAITVKVMAGESWGSGIIFAKQDNTYTVVTNRHVLIFSPQGDYQIQTPDEQTYQARVLEGVDFGNRDLVLLQFSSELAYEVAHLNNSSLEMTALNQEAVFAGGYPMEIESQETAEGFYLNQGNLARLSDRDFGGGYQIGYTNSVKKGMSGGPLLNSSSQVIGINGVHKYPLWGNPYQFSDGSVATETQKQDMSQFSWAIPINTLLKLAPQFNSQNNFPNLPNPIIQ